MADSTSDDASRDAAASPGEEGPFSLRTFRQLVELMEKHGLSEVSLKTGETQWKLRRGPEAVQGFPGMSSGYPPSPPLVAPLAPPPTPVAATPAASGAVEGVFIKSPTVGTFYSAASPDDPPFATIGTRVEPDTIVCLVEAMKVFNQIPAEVSGVIAEVLVKNGDSIEFGQPLFRVKS